MKTTFSEVSRAIALVCGLALGSLSSALGQGCKALTCLAVITAAFLPLAANAEVIISEIMYNPNSNETPTPPFYPRYAEWVEIFNAGPGMVDISGWTLRDEDGAATNALPPGTSIASGEAIVLFSSQITLSEFQSAWGSGFQAFAIDLDGLFGLSNSPNPTNEILELIDDGAASVDTVNYDDEAPWPSDSPDGPSIYVLAGSLSTGGNDDGANWARSAVGVDGGIQNNVTAHIGGIDFGSPGFVAVPEPPVIVEAWASPPVLWPPNNQMVTINVSAVVEDNSGEADWRVDGVECDEPTDADDVELVDDHTVRLRASRSGNGDGRTYMLLLRATYAVGDESEPFPVEVTVPHDQRNKKR